MAEGRVEDAAAAVVSVPKQLYQQVAAAHGKDGAGRRLELAQRMLEWCKTEGVASCAPPAEAWQHANTLVLDLITDSWSAVRRVGVQCLCKWPTAPLQQLIRKLCDLLYPHPSACWQARDGALAALVSLVPMLVKAGASSSDDIDDDRSADDAADHAMRAAGDVASDGDDDDARALEFLPPRPSSTCSVYSTVSAAPSADMPMLVVVMFSACWDEQVSVRDHACRGIDSACHCDPSLQHAALEYALTTLQRPLLPAHVRDGFQAVLARLLCHPAARVDWDSVKVILLQGLHSSSSLVRQGNCALATALLQAHPSMVPRLFSLVFTLLLDTDARHVIWEQTEGTLMLLESTLLQLIGAHATQIVGGAALSSTEHVAAMRRSSSSSSGVLGSPSRRASVFPTLAASASVAAALGRSSVDDGDGGADRVELAAAASALTSSKPPVLQTLVDAELAVDPRRLQAAAELILSLRCDESFELRRMASQALPLLAELLAWCHSHSLACVLGGSRGLGASSLPSCRLESHLMLTRGISVYVQLSHLRAAALASHATLFSVLGSQLQRSIHSSGVLAAMCQDARRRDRLGVAAAQSLVMLVAFVPMNVVQSNAGLFSDTVLAALEGAAVHTVDADTVARRHRRMLLTTLAPLMPALIAQHKHSSAWLLRFLAWALPCLVATSCAESALFDPEPADLAGLYDAASLALQHLAPGAAHSDAHSDGVASTTAAAVYRAMLSDTARGAGLRLLTAVAVALAQHCSDAVRKQAASQLLLRIASVRGSMGTSTAGDDDGDGGDDGDVAAAVDQQGSGDESSDWDDAFDSDDDGAATITITKPRSGSTAHHHHHHHHYHGPSGRAAELLACLEEVSTALTTG